MSISSGMDGMGGRIYRCKDRRRESGDSKTIFKVEKMFCLTEKCTNIIWKIQETFGEF